MNIHVIDYMNIHVHNNASPALTAARIRRPEMPHPTRAKSVSFDAFTDRNFTVCRLRVPAEELSWFTSIFGSIVRRELQGEKVGISRILEAAAQLSRCLPLTIKEAQALPRADLRPLLWSMIEEASCRAEQRRSADRQVAHEALRERLAMTWPEFASYCRAKLIECDHRSEIGEDLASCPCEHQGRLVSRMLPREWWEAAARLANRRSRRRHVEGSLKVVRPAVAGAA